MPLPVRLVLVQHGVAAVHRVLQNYYTIVLAQVVIWQPLLPAPHPHLGYYLTVNVDLLVERVVSDQEVVLRAGGGRWRLREESQGPAILHRNRESVVLAQESVRLPQHVQTPARHAKLGRAESTTDDLVHV